MADTPDLHDELEQVEKTMESLRRLLSGDPLEAALAPLQARRQALLRQQSGGVSVEAERVSVQGDVIGGDKITAGSDSVGRDQIEVGGGSAVATGQGHAIAGSQNVVAGPGSSVTIIQGGGPPTDAPALDRESAVGRYLGHVIEANRCLPLQGIRSASGLVSIDLEEIYITLTATDRRAVSDEEALVDEMSRLAPSESGRTLRWEGHPRETVQQVKVKVQEALAAAARLCRLPGKEPA